jgi:hypothetical protein
MDRAYIWGQPANAAPELLCPEAIAPGTTPTTICAFPHGRMAAFSLPRLR